MKLMNDSTSVRSVLKGAKTMSQLKTMKGVKLTAMRFREVQGNIVDGRSRRP